MEIKIQTPDLEFLRGDAKSAGELVPIKVIKAARLKLQVMSAMAGPEYMGNWKSLDFQSDTEHCSIQVADDWRMAFKSDPSKEPPQITITRLWRHHHG